MLSGRRACWISLSAVAMTLMVGTVARGQSFGVELNNTVMPASGGMGGTSIARPQDVMSAISANAASLTQYRGTNFTFAGAWVESTYNIAHDGGIIPGIGQFDAKSEAEGSVLGNIGVAQELEIMGRRATFGMGLLSMAGAGLSLRDVPESNGTSVTIAILEIAPAVSVEVTDRLSVGASMMLGSATLDAPFQSIGAAATAYSLRGTLGLSFDLGECTTLGTYYQSPQNFNFDDAVRFQVANQTVVQDINAGLPSNIGLGIANDCLADGHLLLAMDVLYKQWETADLFKELYDNQWVLQLGAQYCLTPRVRLRMGYAFAENPLDPNVGQSVGGVLPPGPAERVEATMQYLQSTVAVISRHRISGGVGIRDVMPGIDLDLFAGGMFRESQDLGEYTWVSIQSYWVGGGLTWRFGACGNAGCSTK